eukprot:71233-Pelagomonas_calceolata.AAC.3
MPHGAQEKSCVLLGGLSGMPINKNWAQLYKGESSKLSNLASAFCCSARLILHVSRPRCPVVPTNAPLNQFYLAVHPPTKCPCIP